MRLLEYNNESEFSLTKDFGNDIPPYAILSHTWGADADEVTFKDLTDGIGKSKAGYSKIRFCGEQARRDDLQYFWVDTCCIDKTNNVELSEAINSMFRWYSKATRCYVFLADVSLGDLNLANQSSESWKQDFQKSRWFTRGWTLQELIAPPLVEFFSSEWKLIGNKESLVRELQAITGIAVQALEGDALSTFSIAERMSWAENRKTKREEDKAYSLLGIFDVYMPLIYGEGVNNAFRRLRKEISEHSDDLLNRLPLAVEAPFNSYRRQYEPNCLENTRVDLLNEIEDWINEDGQQSIFWLNGLAGTGKSTIARTVARKLYSKQLLGASFFFSRGGGDVGHAGKFVTSVAKQLASNIPDLYQHVCDAVQEYVDIQNQSLLDQWNHLVLGPLSKLAGRGCHLSYFLIVDALDECDDDNSIQSILHFLASSKFWNNVGVRIFLTSRPEIPVRYGFSQIAEADRHDFVLHNISPSIVDHDIFVFLEYNLRLIARERHLGDIWPGEEVIRSLVQSASGLFIWAATACRFISDGRRFAVQRLHTILHGNHSTVATPDKHLNEIYLTVLKHSMCPSYNDEEKDYQYKMLKSVLGCIVTLVSPLCASSLGALLQLTKLDIDQTLEDLHSILDVPDNQIEPIRLLHPSFRDFLLDSSRYTDNNFQVNEKQAHQLLANGCIQLLSKSLKKDICKLDDPGVLANNIERSRIERHLPSEVQYACLYWIQHLQKSETPLQDNDQFHQFLRKHYLHWLEALGWMRKISEGIHAVTFLESTTSAQECPFLHQFVRDAKRFALYNRGAIEQAPLQVYCSAIVFSPTNSIVRKQFEDDVSQWMERLPEVEENWSALLQTIEGHSEPVVKIALAPNGKLIASGSRDGSIKIWDATSGIALHTFSDAICFELAFSHDSTLLALITKDLTSIKLLNTTTGATVKALIGHTKSITSIAFSPQNKLLASASENDFIKLWDYLSGDVIRTLGERDSFFHSLAFSSDGKLLASGLSNYTIHLWNVTLGVIQHVLDGHNRRISVIAFSPDDKLIASASKDRQAIVWDAELGTVLWTLRHTGSWFHSSLAFSPNGTLTTSGEFPGIVELWDIATGALLRKLKCHDDLVNAIALSPNGTVMVSASDDGTIKLWDAASVRTLQSFEGHSSETVCQIAFSPNGELLASGNNEGTVKLWHTAPGLEPQILGSHADMISSVVFSHDGKLLASGCYRGILRVWDVSSGEQLQSLSDDPDGRSSDCIRSLSLVGELVAWVSYARTVKLADIVSGEILRKFTVSGFYGERPSATLSPDGKLLAIRARGHIGLWDVSSARQLRTFTFSADLRSLRFSDDGTFLQTSRAPVPIALPSPLAASSNSCVPLIIVTGPWVSRGKTKLLWLHAGYRPKCYSVCGGLVALGLESGRIVIMKFVP